jgi:hypothetical protein
MPVGRVVRDEVEDQSQPTVVGRGDQAVDVVERAEDRIDVAVVHDVVPKSTIGER